jgi:hypothetical protein
MLSFSAGDCQSEKWLPDLLENSRCHKNHLKSILYSMLLDVDLQNYLNYGSCVTVLHHMQFRNSWTVFTEH